MCSHNICKRVNIRNYRIAYTSALGESEGEVHHIDHNRKNNCLLNLVLLTKDEHMLYHGSYPSDAGGISDFLGVSILDVDTFEKALSVKLSELKSEAKKSAMEFINDMVDADTMMMSVNRFISQSYWLSCHSDEMIENSKVFNKVKMVVDEKIREQHSKMNIS